jgi:hypothetical protein
MAMGQKILDKSGSPQAEPKQAEPKPTEGKVLDMPKRALIIASLKRKIGE